MFIVKTSNPTTLLRHIRDGLATLPISQWRADAAGHLEYEGDASTDHFLVRAEVNLGALHCDVVQGDATPITVEQYALRNARLLELLMSRFNRDFVAIEVNAFRLMEAPRRSPAVGDTTVA